MIGSIASNIVIALIVLSVIIVIHELGHFLVAKFFKIKVETFSVGFGPRLVGFAIGETDYRISAFLLGGYVKMAGETPSDTITGEAYEFLSKPKWQRFLVAAAGPAMNVFLAIGLVMGLYLYGTDVPEFVLGQAVIGIVEPGSPAEKAGLQPGDLVVSLDDKEKPDWQAVQNDFLTSPGRTLPIVIERAGRRIQTTITPERRGREEAGYAGMLPVIRTVVRAVQPNSPAMAAGVKPGDEIIRVNGVDLRNSGRTIQQAIQETTEKTFPITVVRNENQRQEIVLDVTPVLRDGRKMIGIDVPFPTVHMKLGLLGALQKSIETNKENAVLIFQVIGRLIKRQASLRQLDGPVGIVAVSGQAYEAGLDTLLTFMAVISLNLGILNILPIPILDGGVILLLVIESLMGHDLSLRMKERIVQASFVFLLMLTVIVLYNDVVKLLPPGQPSP
ncbi:MAG: RIP metalloprotease RseP [Acidobacteria bacterium 13_1_20CM_2_55_15]|nr:MAG: RIP metalloprotease RseP [Acidobacteria bacterium 13_1_40CM_56_16]OLD19175.1 MAG: RIP metalloprotease RseP [Acidobacteria bacterium 13_1_40CM_3_56_11]OLD68277.1 MAG: RIP metalloprotease RseP [Acidobacteria bacterium 13_1_40CM_2_56_11]OLE88891.1 MAG: RIP metalloprotease RseP [Acidobacteria bacterium 13_1_20CM_2_55_15]PYR71925.1 MAG: RIP metalloprotease RseP [Acidobacteriota bacterium]